jgi:2,3-bisphosphoglycerate-dependent phosphoglycerate mutase
MWSGDVENGNMSRNITLYFLRHGRSSGDDEGVHEGRYDSALTKTGRMQAQTRALNWKERGTKFDLIISSTLQRAHETARIIAEILLTPLETDADWMEMDNRPLAGLPFDVAASRYPRPAFRNLYEPFYGEGESDWEIHCRAIRATEKIIRRGVGSYLVVSHGGILNAALRSIVGASPPINGQHGIWFALGDTGYAKTVYTPAKHQWLLEQLIPEWEPE